MWAWKANGGSPKVVISQSQSLRSEAAPVARRRAFKGRPGAFGIQLQEGYMDQIGWSRSTGGNRTANLGLRFYHIY